MIAMCVALVKLCFINDSLLVDSMRVWNRCRWKQFSKQFLQLLENKGLIEDYGEIKDWLGEDVYSIGSDGHQIRNIVPTALQLVRAEWKYRGSKGRLSKKHLKLVVQNARAFKGDFMVQYDRYITSQQKLIK